MITQTNDGWQELFHAAILETNPLQLSERIKLAIAAIEQRHRELPAAGRDEAQRIADAVMTLRLLAKTELHDPALSDPQEKCGPEGTAL